MGIRVHVRQYATHSGPTLADEVMRRITERDQARARSNGTFSAYNWRYDSRRVHGRDEFVEEPDSQAAGILARCRTTNAR